MRGRANWVRIVQAIVGVGLVVTGLGNLGIIGGWGDAGTKWGHVVAGLSTLAGLCTIASVAIRKKRGFGSGDN